MSSAAIFSDTTASLFGIAGLLAVNTTLALASHTTGTLLAGVMFSSSTAAGSPVLSASTTAATTPAVINSGFFGSLPPDALPPVPFHFAHLLSIKLTPENYLYWRAQVLPLLRSHSLMGFVDGSFPCPPLSVNPAAHRA